MMKHQGIPDAAGLTPGFGHFVWAFVFLMLWEGCQHGPAFKGQPPTASVEGELSYQGKPVPNAYLAFFPDGEGEAGAAVTDKNGHFRVSTYRRFDGAVLGEHTVTVNVPPEEPELPGVPENRHKPGIIPGIYVARETSPIRILVKPDVTNHCDLVIKK